MAEAGTLHDAFIDELPDRYDDRKLRQAFESHLEETHGQIGRLEQVFESLHEKVGGKHCEGIAGSSWRPLDRA